MLIRILCFMLSGRFSRDNNLSYKLKVEKKKKIITANKNYDIAKDIEKYLTS